MRINSKIMLDNEQICILELIKSSLFGICPELSEDANWEKIFEVAQKQCIVPMISSCVPAEHRSEWSKISAQFKAYFMQMIYAQNVLVKLLNDNNIPFVILKGTAASIYYPTPLLRTFGDIDFYVSQDHFDFVVKLLNRSGFKYVSSDTRHYEFEKYGIDFELHNKFSCNHYNDIDSVILNGLNNAVELKIDRNSFPVLPVCENGLILLGHIMQHLKTSGIGLRQIIDWMMFVHKELDDFMWENEFRSYAVEAGLEKLAITVTYMCKKWLGLPDKITWCNSANDEIADQLLIRVLDDGNLGQERAPVEIIKQSMRKEGIFTFLQHEGLKNWTLAQKHCVFIPVAWLYQICRYACQGISSLITGKRIFGNKNNMSIEELLNELD